MKKIIILLGVSILLSGCSSSQKNQNSLSSSSANQKIITNAVYSPESKLGTYTNYALGISLKYPTKLGSIKESKDSKGKLLAYKIGYDIQLSSVEKDDDSYTRSCTDLLKNGSGKFLERLSGCETIKIDGKNAQVLEFKQSLVTNEPARIISFPTKNGIWKLKSTDKDNFDIVVAMAKSIKYRE